MDDRSDILEAPSWAPLLAMHDASDPNNRSDVLCVCIITRTKGRPDDLRRPAKLGGAMPDISIKNLIDQAGKQVVC
ncbi:hypothetical protein ACP70R_012907 [Stipagrostis hirtigluma subsp. patula]